MPPSHGVDSNPGPERLVSILEDEAVMISGGIGAAAR
jgi:hypothetical protein